MSKIIGIDLGTTFSAVAVMEGGKAKIIPNSEGSNTTPSVVSIKNGEVIVGDVARRQSIVNPKNTIRSIKRLMGTKEPTTIEGKDYSPEEISAMILQKLKRDAESYLGTPVKEAVITVPAYFDDAQRQATKNAGKIAGLDVKRIVNEPTAAALAYGIDKIGDKTVLVFDFGGGTFDVSILELGDGVFEVKSTSGDNHLGGDDIDEILIDHFAKEFKKQHGIDLREDPVALQRLKEAAEKAKKELSSSMQTDVSLPFVTATPNGPLHFDMKLTRTAFEQLCDPIFERLKGPVRQALKDAKVSGLDHVILVGGSTRIPKVQYLVKEITGKEPDRSVHPDEAVALGAAIQAGILGGEVRDILLLDVTPLTLGIETLGGIRTPLIQRNTTIPTRKSQVFSTAADSQTSVEINVLQGEREMAADNKSLGRFVLEGIPPAPRGIPQIEVAFDIDANGIVNVSAKDLATGKQQRTTIVGGTSLSKEEVERMVKDAEANAAEDQKKKEAIDIRNNADQVVYATEKMLHEYGDKVDKKLAGEVQKEIDKLKEAQKTDDTSKIKSALDDVQKKAQELGAQMYAQAAKQQPSESKDDDDVVDAEVVDEKPGKKK